MFVKLRITVTTERNEPIDGYNGNLILKNNGPFSSYILKINNALVGNTEDLDVIMLMYNLIEYSKN